jgi:ABC-2 type transport system permease protein
LNLRTSLTVAEKEMKVLGRKKSIVSYIIGLPLLISVSFSLFVYQQSKLASGIPTTLSIGLESISFIFVVLAATLPAGIAAYSVVGEKVEKSLEPLLATPVTDGEILLGKSIAAFVPPILATWGGASIFMAATDYATHDLLSYYYFPEWSSAVMLLLLAPLAAISSIELAVFVSSRVSDVRGANQISGLMFIPFILIFIEGTNGGFTFSVYNLLLICGVLAIVDLALFFLSTATFKREEILTKWK